MGLLRLLGIEKYLKKVKNYVDEQDTNVNQNIATNIDQFTDNIFAPAVDGLNERVSVLEEKPTPEPDWNAGEGENGYIKNKPFGDSIDKNIEVPADFDPDMGEPLMVQLPYFSMGIYVKLPICNPISGDVYGYDVLNAVNGKGTATIAHPAGDLHINIYPESDGAAMMAINNINLDNAYLVDYITYKEYEEAETTTIIKKISQMYLPETIKDAYLCNIAQFGGDNIMDHDFAEGLIKAIVDGKTIEVKLNDNVTFTAMNIHRVMGSGDSNNSWNTSDPFNNTFSLTAIINNGLLHVYSVFFENWGGEWYCTVTDKEL